MSAPARPTLMPLYELIKAHVFAAERIHGDDTTVPVLAKVKTRTGRIWTYVRDDRPFGGKAPPAAVFFYSPDRASIHPEQHLAGYCGILQADAYAGFNTLYEPDRKPGPITRSRLLGACATQAVRACRHRFEGAQPEADDDLADRFRGGSEVRRHLRAGTLDQRLVARSSAWPRAAETSRRW